MVATKPRCSTALTLQCCRASWDQRERDQQAVHKTNVKSTHLVLLRQKLENEKKMGKKEPTVLCSLWHPLHTTPQTSDVLSSVYVHGWMDGQRGCINNTDRRNQFGGLKGRWSLNFAHDQSSRTKESIQTAGIIPQWRLLPSSHPHPAEV